MKPRVRMIIIIEVDLSRSIGMVVTIVTGFPTRNFRDLKGSKDESTISFLRLSSTKETIEINT
jgi:hypothetical protein